MKPFTRAELVRIRQRLDRLRINDGFELPQPLAHDKAYLCGGEYLKPEEMVPRLVIALLSLRAAVGIDDPEELVLEVIEQYSVPRKEAAPAEFSPDARVKR